MVISILFLSFFKNLCSLLSACLIVLKKNQKRFTMRLFWECSSDLIVTHKSLSRGERGKKLSCLSMTPVGPLAMGVIERQESLKPRPPMERGLVRNDYVKPVV